jgi:inositol 1,4,5-triphosphate receptor type 1
VRLLQCPLQGAPDQTHLTRVFRGAYDVLYTYMIGNSRKNSLYFAKYIDFFQTQITVKAVSKSSSILECKYLALLLVNCPV